MRCCISWPVRVLNAAGIPSLNLAGRPFLGSPPWIRRTHTAGAFPNLKPLNVTITRFMRNGLVDEARKLFDEMPHRNTVTWNAMIRGYFQNGQFQMGFYLYDRMPVRDTFSYNTVILGLMQGGNVDCAKRVFEEMPAKDVVTWNSMISGYVHNGLIGEAVEVFDEMPLKDVVSWNLVISALVSCKEVDLANKLFEEMNYRDTASWTIMLSGLASAGRIVEARELFDDMPERDIQAWNSMIAGYITNGYVERGEALFWKMLEHDFGSWNELVNGLVRNGRINDAMMLFIEMPRKCRRPWNTIIMGLISNELFKEAHAFLVKSPYSDIVSWTNMIIGYFEIGEVEDAVKLFELLPARDTTVWNATIFGLGKNDQGEVGLKFFIKMKEGGPCVDEATYTSVITICADMAALQLGKQVHAQVIKTGSHSFTAVSNAMVTMYARCGNMDSALIEFSSMPIHDVISWNSVICGLAHHGNGDKALDMFERMKQSEVMPNGITFIGVLAACSHAGLVEQGRHGLIDEAIDVLHQIQADGVEIPASAWGAMLQACRMHKNSELGEIAGRKVLEMEPCNSGFYMILAEMYLSSGKRGNAERIWTRMKEKGIKKQPGCSWIEINNCEHVFLAGEIFHPEFCKICCILHLMHMEMETEVSELNSGSAQEIKKKKTIMESVN